MNGNIINEYAMRLLLLREIEAACLNIYRSSHVEYKSYRQRLVAALYARIIKHISAAGMLIERGLQMQSHVLLRAGLETLFTPVAVIRDEGFTVKYIAAHQIERKKFFNKYKSVELQNYTNVMATDEIGEEIKA